MTTLLTRPPEPVAVASVRTDRRDGFAVLCLRSAAGLEARFAPTVGMTCCSVTLDGEELLGQRYGLEAYAGGGVTMGQSLMHPWADRLSAWSYPAAGRTVRLPVSPLLHTDAHGLPVNGIQATGPAWTVVDQGADATSAWLIAELAFDADPRRLALFPFPHCVRMRAEVAGRSLFVFTELTATSDVPVPVCFGFRTYLRHDDAAHLHLPRRRGPVTDDRLIPTGAVERRPARLLHLGADFADEAFALGRHRRLTVRTGGRAVTLEPMAGYPLAEVRTQPGQRQVRLEALTAAPDALRRGAHPVATLERPYRALLRLGA